jgi:nitrogen fixation NifU-like protein
MNNPLCGDVIELSLSVQADRIDEVRYEGRGCSISQAAASMMTERLKGAKLGLEVPGTDQVRPSGLQLPR